MEIVKTDVLVIGGGGAGLRAALAAREKGAEVLLVSKTPMGKSTCTYLSGGGFSLAGEGMSEEMHLDLTLKAGRGINARELAEILVEEGPTRVRELEGYGLAGVWRKGGFSVLGRAPAWGAPLTEALARATRERGVSERPWVMVFDLLKEEGKIVGALGFEFRKGVPIALLSKATILANGGGGALYQRHDNPVRTTGDGYALAFHAGCRLRDMEFVQFIPQGLAEPGKPAHLISVYLADAGKITNSSAEDILEKYQIKDRPVAIRCRDSFSLAIFKEEREGREVFLDLRSLGENDWPKDHVSQSQRAMFMKSLSCGDKPLRISPMCHFFIGGVVMDSEGKTEIPGLFAAGEVTGGLHGANRLGGNALGEIIVFGYRAGNAAAEWSREQDWSRGYEPLISERLDSWRKKWATSPEGIPPRDLRKKIGEILWKEGGILRDGNGLSSASGAIREMKEEDLPRTRANTPKEVLERMEVENALLVGEMILKSAALREESRGAHYRKDFPKVDDQNWKGNTFLRKSEKGMNLEFRPLVGKKV